MKFTVPAHRADLKKSPFTGFFVNDSDRQLNIVVATPVAPPSSHGQPNVSRLSGTRPKGLKMAMAKTMGVVVLVLVALWLIFALVGVLTAIIKSVLVVLIVVAICYAVYHHFKRR